jgi:hypothetical protein
VTIFGCLAQGIGRKDVAVNCEALEMRPAPGATTTTGTGQPAQHTDRPPSSRRPLVSPRPGSRQPRPQPTASSRPPPIGARIICASISMLRASCSKRRRNINFFQARKAVSSAAAARGNVAHW